MGSSSCFLQSWNCWQPQTATLPPVPFPLQYSPPQSLDQSSAIKPTNSTPHLPPWATHGIHSAALQSAPLPSHPAESHQFPVMGNGSESLRLPRSLTSPPNQTPRAASSPGASPPPEARWTGWGVALFVSLLEHPAQPTGSFGAVLLLYAQFLSKNWVLPSQSSTVFPWYKTGSVDLCLSRHEGWKEKDLTSFAFTVAKSVTTATINSMSVMPFFSTMSSFPLTETVFSHDGTYLKGSSTNSVISCFSIIMVLMV